ncbi:Pol [Symbiodinium sp. CCMP2592]|nr:Pol [Symbiodinium sp. CCMP2592]
MDMELVALHGSNKIPRVSAALLYFDPLGNFVEYYVLGFLIHLWSFVPERELFRRQGILRDRWEYAGAFRVWFDGWLLLGNRGRLALLRKTMEHYHEFGAVRHCRAMAVFRDPGQAVEALYMYFLPVCDLSTCPCFMPSRAPAMWNMIKSGLETRCGVHMLIVQEPCANSEDLDADESSQGGPAPTTPGGTPLPPGPPPPQPVQARKHLSQRLSSLIADFLSHEGVEVDRVLTYIPPNYKDLRSWRVAMDYMGQQEAANHPNTLYVDDSAPEDAGDADDGFEGHSESIEEEPLDGGTRRAGTTTSTASGSRPSATVTHAINSAPWHGTGGDTAAPRPKTNRKSVPQLLVTALPGLGARAPNRLCYLGDDVTTDRTRSSQGCAWIGGGLEPKADGSLLALPFVAVTVIALLWLQKERGPIENTSVIMPALHSPIQSCLSACSLSSLALLDRLRIVSWNSGGLTSTRYKEVLAWLQQSHEAGCTYDVCILQETMWPQDSEFIAKLDGPNHLQWHAVHSAGKSHEGILCLVRTGVVPAENIRYNVLEPGRLVHVRLLLCAPCDILCTYQWSWNPGKVELQGTNRVEEMLRQRRRIWQAMDKWLSSIPRRSTCIVVGDFNCSLVPERPVCGEGVPTSGGGHPDQESFQEIARTHGCCALNTWRTKGPHARTYLPPNATAQHGSQIDFVLFRGQGADQTARNAGPLQAEFVPHTGCRHLPIQAVIPAPRRPTTRPAQQRVAPRLAQSALRQADFQYHLQGELDGVLHSTLPENLADGDVNQWLLAGWNATTRALRREGPATPTQTPGDTLTLQVKKLWSLRTRAFEVGRQLGQWQRNGPSARQVFQAWLVTTQLQAHNRTLRKECRRKKIEKVAEVVRADNIYQAAKRFAPRTPKRRIQLRKEDGSLQTHEAEFRQIVCHFEDLYSGETGPAPALPEALNITLEEIQFALSRLQPGKAMPSDSAPAVLWKWYGHTLAPVLHQQFQKHLGKGACSLPEAWTLSELVLIPKAGKPMKTPAHLRPISLLPPQAKLLATVLAQRIQEPMKLYLTKLPQYAYVEGRTIHQAVERVISHCAEVRCLVQGNTHTIHNKRQGRESLSLYGGIHLSLDLTGAYDHVQWPLLRQALEAANIPEVHIQTILLIHSTARLQVRHCGMEQNVQLKRGLRQGCSLSPSLWAVFSGWLLQRMHDPQLLDVHRTNTSYADDQHFGWTIRNGKDLEGAYAAMRHILACLLQAGLKVSQEKTVIVLELQGAYATKALARYTVDRPQGKYFRFDIAGNNMYIKIVPKHVYLGVVISFRKFEVESFKHRLTLARSTFSRLGVILRNKNVPSRLRLILWRGCVWPALFYGLDSTGLPQKELTTLLTQLIKQARAITNSHSMFTKERNEDFVRRLGLPDPVKRLQNALRQREALDCSLSPELAPGPAQLQWRHIVRGHLFEGVGCWSHPTGMPISELVSVCSTECTSIAALLEGEPLRYQELREATQDLSLLRSMIHQTQPGMASNMDWSRDLHRARESELWEDSERPPKWSRPDQKGQKGNRGGKGQNPRRQAPHFGNSGRDHQPGPPTRKPQQQTDERAAPTRQEMQEFRNILGIMKTLVLRQETQQTIMRQDTGFMVFVQTNAPGNLAQSLYRIGQQWNTMKREDPTALQSPMRVVLYQHLLETIKDKFLAMMNSPSSRSKAAEMGWISQDGKEVYAVKWDMDQQKHVKDATVGGLSPQEIEEALTELIILAPEVLVVQRFHATRQLAEEYQSPVIGMFLEVGLRTTAAQTTWRRLHMLARSATWAAGGCFLRHERMQMSALAKRLANLME